MTNVVGKWINQRLLAAQRRVAYRYFNLQESAPSFTERAPRATDPWLGIEQYNGLTPPTDPILQNQQMKASRDYSYWWGLYDEARDKDPHLASCLEQRKAAVLAHDRNVIPGEDTDRGKYAASFVQEALNRLTYGLGDGGFQRDLGDLMDAIPNGIAIQEVVWDFQEFPVPAEDAVRKRPKRWLIPQALKSRHPRRFGFDRNDQLLLVSRENPMGTAVPDRQFIVFRPYTRYEDPYGYALLRPVWWIIWFKRKVMTFWLDYCEKFGSPAMTADIDPSTPISPAERTKLLEALQSIQQDSAIVPPPGAKIRELLVGNGTTYQDFIRFCNEEISKAVIGQTLTSTTPKGGNLSLGEVHERVAASIQAQDARALEDILNGTLVRWLIDFNLPGYPYPKFEIVTLPTHDQLQEAEMIRAYIDMGLPVSQSEAAARSGLKVAKTDDDRLVPIPAPYKPGDPAGQPSQETDAKTAARAKQRDAKAPGKDSAKPAPTR